MIINRYEKFFELMNTTQFSNVVDMMSHLEMCFNSFDDISCSISSMNSWRKIVIIHLKRNKYKYDELKDMIEEAVEKSDDFGFYCSCVFIEGGLKEDTYTNQYMWLGDSDLHDKNRYNFYNPEFRLPDKIYLDKIGNTNGAMISGLEAYISRINVYFKLK